MVRIFNFNYFQNFLSPRITIIIKQRFSDALLRENIFIQNFDPYMCGCDAMHNANSLCVKRMTGNRAGEKEKLFNFSSCRPFFCSSHMKLDRIINIGAHRDSTTTFKYNYYCAMIWESAMWPYCNYLGLPVRSDISVMKIGSNGKKHRFARIIRKSEFRLWCEYMCSQLISFNKARRKDAHTKAYEHCSAGLISHEMASFRFSWNFNFPFYDFQQSTTIRLLCHNAPITCTPKHSFSHLWEEKPASIFVFAFTIRRAYQGLQWLPKNKSVNWSKEQRLKEANSPNHLFPQLKFAIRNDRLLFCLFAWTGLNAHSANDMFKCFSPPPVYLRAEKRCSKTFCRNRAETSSKLKKKSTSSPCSFAVQCEFRMRAIGFFSFSMKIPKMCGFGGAIEFLGANQLIFHSEQRASQKFVNSNFSSQKVLRIM